MTRFKTANTRRSYHINLSLDEIMFIGKVMGNMKYLNRDQQIEKELLIQRLEAIL